MSSQFVDPVTGEIRNAPSPDNYTPSVGASNPPEPAAPTPDDDEQPSDYDTFLNLWKRFAGSGGSKSVTGFERFLAGFLTEAGGKKLSGADGKTGWVHGKGRFRGKSTPEVIAAAMDAWERLGPQDRGRFEEPIPGLTRSAPGSPGFEPGRGGPTSRYSDHFTGLDGMAPPKPSSPFDRMPAPDGVFTDPMEWERKINEAKLNPGKYSTEQIKAMEEQANAAKERANVAYGMMTEHSKAEAQRKHDAGIGVTHRGADGSVAFKDGARIAAPDAAGRRSIENSRYGTGSATNGQPAAAPVAASPTHAEPPPPAPQPIQPGPATASIWSPGPSKALPINAIWQPPPTPAVPGARIPGLTPAPPSYVTRPGAVSALPAHRPAASAASAPPPGRSATAAPAVPAPGSVVPPSVQQPAQAAPPPPPKPPAMPAPVLAGAGRTAAQQPTAMPFPGRAATIGEMMFPKPKPSKPATAAPLSGTLTMAQPGWKPPQAPRPPRPSAYPRQQYA